VCAPGSGYYVVDVVEDRGASFAQCQTIIQLMHICVMNKSLPRGGAAKMIYEYRLPEEARN